MKYLHNPSQERLKYTYEDAQARLGYAPEIEEMYRKRLQELPIYTNEEDAIKAVADMENNGAGGYLWIWANIGVDEEYFYIQDDYFLVTNDGLMHQAAEYLGMVNLMI